MPYIFHNNQAFSLIDATPKNGIFCQHFSTSYSPKPIQIQLQGNKEYSAHMDEKGNLYVATMPDAFHLNYFLYENNRFIKNTLISNNSSNYQLSNPMIYSLNGTPFIAYLSHQTHSNAYNFVQENLFSPNLTTLLTTYTMPQHIKCFTSSDVTYIFFIIFDEIYHLNAIKLTPNSVNMISFINSPEPIIDYSVCLDEEIIHITYVAELHGKYELCYFNTASNHLTLLTTTQYPSYPVVFCYYHVLWINAMIDHKLKMLISMDDGEHFSIPVPCSTQNNIHRCQFKSYQASSLIAFELYAAIGASLKLCTIAMADVEHIHPDTFVPPELELLLEGLILTASRQPEPAPVAPPAPPTISRKKKSAPPVNEVDEAKNAFMNELNGWDLPPRI